MNALPENINKIAVELLEIIEKYYPGLTKKKYDNHGFADEKGYSALSRAKFCIYIKLLKAGAFENEDSTAVVAKS